MSERVSECVSAGPAQPINLNPKTLNPKPINSKPIKLKTTFVAAVADVAAAAFASGVRELFSE